MNESNARSYLDVLNAFPIPVFVVDDDVRILDVNTAAKEMFGLEKPAFHMRRGGEVLHCLHSHDVPEGCGRGPFCKSCVIRNSVNHSLKGSVVTRRRMKYEFRTPSGTKQMELLITASAMPQDGGNLALLIVEDISEITSLRNIIPICLMCKKVRTDQQYWQELEHYFSIQIGVDFSHGLCPDCATKAEKLWTSGNS